VKALSVRQPWTWAIARGFKTVENRTWSTPYRGPLAIHAGQRWDDSGEVALRFVVDTLRAQGLPCALQDEWPLSGVGMVVATVDLVDICGDGVHGECDCGPWAAAGQMHWRLANARPLAAPVAAKGRLGLWDIDLEAAA
jgi:hypothetical protein